MGKNKTSCINKHKNSFFKNEIGKKYGRLTVLNRADNSKFGTARWNCICDCGNLVTINAGTLRNGQTKSCGCLISEINHKRRSGNAVFKRLYHSIKTYSKKKNIPFDLTLEDIKFITKQKCTYCGRDPYLEKKAYMYARYNNTKYKDETEIINGIDKIIPEKGYILENCVSCCKYCNRAKSDLLPEDFKNLIILIYNNYART